MRKTNSIQWLLLMINIAQTLPTTSVCAGGAGGKTARSEKADTVGPGGSVGPGERGPEVQWDTVAAAVSPGAASRVPANLIHY